MPDCRIAAQGACNTCTGSTRTNTAAGRIQHPINLNADGPGNHLVGSLPLPRHDGKNFMALTTIPLWRMVFDQGAITHDVLQHQYPGSGTDDDPYRISWITNDPRNPLDFRTGPRWAICGLASIATLTVTLGSSTYSGGMEQIREEFHTGQEVALLGISMWVLGFALGPMVWAPLSEIYGRRPISILSSLGLAIFTAGSVGAKNIETLVILRFFAGSLGSSPMAVSGSIIADAFPPVVRGMSRVRYQVYNLRLIHQASEVTSTPSLLSWALLWAL